MPVIEQNFIFPSDLDPDVFGEKTKGGKKYITVTVGAEGAEGAGADTNEVQFGTETKTVERVYVNGEPADFIFTEVLNHNQQGKRMFVLTDVIQDDTSLVYPSNNEISPSEPDAGIDLPQPTGVDYAPLAGRTAIGIFPDGSGVEGGYIMMPLNREYTLPFDVKVVTDRQNITATNSTMRKTDDGFVFSITDYPGGYDQTVSFKIADSDPSMKLRLEFPDGNVKEYTPS